MVSFWSHPSPIPISVFLPSIFLVQVNASRMRSISFCTDISFSMGRGPKSTCGVTTTAWRARCGCLRNPHQLEKVGRNPMEWSHDLQCFIGIPIVINYYQLVQDFFHPRWIYLSIYLYMYIYIYIYKSKRIANSWKRKYPLVIWHSYRKPPFLLGKLTISMAMLIQESRNPHVNIWRWSFEGSFFGTSLRHT